MSSCDLIDRYGCTGSTATNYDAEANRDDGSCTFTSSGILYWDFQTNNYFVNNGVTTIDILLGENKVLDNADISTFDYLNFPQSCSGTTWPFFTTSITQSSYAETHVRVYNQSDSLIISDVVALAEGCSWYQISPY